MGLTLLPNFYIRLGSELLFFLKLQFIFNINEEILTNGHIRKHR